MDTEKIAQALKNSLESTIGGFSMFIRSLEASKIEKSIPHYRQLQAVLLQQRLWALNHRRKELDALWQRIEEAANRIYALINPLAQIMLQLKRFLTVCNTTSKVTQQPHAELKTIKKPTESSILGVLLEPKSISAIRLARILNCPKTEVICSMSVFIKKGVVKKIGWGNGLSFRLIDARPRDKGEHN